MPASIDYGLRAHWLAAALLAMQVERDVLSSGAVRLWVKLLSPVTGEETKVLRFRILLNRLFSDTTVKVCEDTSYTSNNRIGTINAGVTYVPADESTDHSKQEAAYSGQLKQTVKEFLPTLYDAMDELGLEFFE